MNGTTKPVAEAAATTATANSFGFQSVRPLGRLRPGEGTSVAVLAGYAFLFLVCYYILKTLREPLLLESGSAELKSYASAVIASLLLLLVPLHGVLFRHTRRRQLLQWISVVFAVNLGVFALLGHAGTDIGFLYYVWVGIFGLVMLAQFWAHAAHTLGVERGQRLFPVIMAGATFGGLAGPLLYQKLFSLLGPWNLMLAVTGLLIASCPLIASMKKLPASTVSGVPPAQAASCAGPDRRANLLGGLSLVIQDRYLLSLAAMAVLLNCVNTTGEYMLAELVLRHVGDQVAVKPSLEAKTLIGSFYADYYFSVNVLAVVVQVLLVGRLFRRIGVPGTLLILPVFAFIAYGLIAFVPIFSIIRAIKIAENSADYSLMNTARHALFLPLPAEKKYQGKTAIDTFFWRLGDVVQAGIVFAGLNWLGFRLHDFAIFNMVLALAWIFLARGIGRSYTHRTEPDRKPVWRPLGTSIAAAALSSIALVVPANAQVGPPRANLVPPTAGRLFTDHEPLELEFLMDMRTLCRHPEWRVCEDAPATLVYSDTGGHEHRITVNVRTRGRVRTAECEMPALFLFFPDATSAGTPFEGQTMLPLTTHCKLRSRNYEQYVLAEYVAYRIYNELTDRSLRVRLAHITYRDPRRPKKSAEGYGFFTEHFDSLAARMNGQVIEPERFDPGDADPRELGVFALFQYLIGNTDWSVIYRHNVVLVRDAAGTPVPVPYDFDYSGLVNAEYAIPPENLPLRTVTERLFRGFCRTDTDWPELLDLFAQKRGVALGLLDEAPGMRLADRSRASAFLKRFFEDAGNGDLLIRRIEEDCRDTKFR